MIPVTVGVAAEDDPAADLQGRTGIGHKNGIVAAGGADVERGGEHGAAVGDGQRIGGPGTARVDHAGVAPNRTVAGHGDKVAVGLGGIADGEPGIHEQAAIGNDQTIAIGPGGGAEEHVKEARLLTTPP